ncbi:MAG: hypothetical protein LC746_12285 [Acidobacteria bacterium]|nr:hypothetical protein [Acidobacteriota bacterium]
MADYKGDEAKNTQPKAMGAAAGMHSSAQGDPNALTNTTDTNRQSPNAARGGRREDQLSGETQRGAHNNEMRGANPRGNKR